MQKSMFPIMFGKIILQLNVIWNTILAGMMVDKMNIQQIPVYTGYMYNLELESL